MLLNHFRIAVRNLLRHKSLSLINMTGLAMGIATCLLILLFVQHELSYDRYTTKSDRTYRVVLRGSMQGGELRDAHVMPPVAQTLKSDLPEVEEATRLYTEGRPLINVNNRLYKDEPFAYADQNFFSVFDLKFISGNPATALARPDGIVITEAMAMKYFGKRDVIGQLIELKTQQKQFTVTGVVEDMPRNAHFNFSHFASMAGLERSREPTWTTSNFYTYLVLPKGHDYKKTEARLPAIVDKYLGPQLKQALGLTLQEFKQSGNRIGLFLQPLTDIHLHSDYSGELEPRGDIRYIYIFSAIGVFMLLIASINFMNLSTAGAARRAKEVGIRKVLGSLKKQLVLQFLAESLLLTLVSMIAALILVYWALPYFNNLAGQQLALDLWDNPWTIPFLFLFVLFTGLLAGSYPAFFLSSFKPIAVLKGRFASSKKSIGFRSGLVVFQFFISISLIVATTVVYQQLAYIQQTKLGYDKEQVLVVHDTYWLGKNAETFRQQIMADPRIKSVTASGYVPAGPTNNNNFFIFPGTRSTQMVKTLRYEVDYDYLGTLGMEMKSGRNFSKDFGTDSSAIIINETAARALGWDDGSLGQTITHNDNNGTIYTYTVIGIVKDFHFRSLKERITPLVMTLGTNYATMIVKLNTADLQPVLQQLETNWNAFKPDAAFGYTFLDERVNKTYQAEHNIATILTIFAALTIFVACLGLFGLATFTAKQRAREIGIRKVLGASVTGIVAMLSRNFLKLVLIAFLVSVPVAAFIMNRWLQDFAYRISINGWVFAIAAAIALFITLLTVSVQAIKAASANPVKSLRND